MIWIAVLGGVFLLALLFISIAKPSNPSGADVVVRPPTSGADSLFAATATVPASGTPAPTATASPASGVSSGFSLGGGQGFPWLGGSLLWSSSSPSRLSGCAGGAKRRPAHVVHRVSARPRHTRGRQRPHRSISVAIGDRVIAIGATTQQLSFLSELTGDESSKLLESLATQPDQPIAAFASRLFQSMRGNRSKSSPPQDRWRTIGDE